MRNRLVILMGLWLWAGPLMAADQPSKAEDEADRARRAANVFAEIMSAPDRNIPSALLERAHAMAVVPHVVEGAYVIGGSYGKGLIAHRQENGEWSAPAFIDITGASLGFQAGASATDHVLVFTDEEGFRPLLENKIKLGADASIAAGPVGRTASAATDIGLDSAIYSYSRSKGAFVGVALDGAAVSLDDSANEKAYGRQVSGEEILLRRVVTINSVVKPFHDALQRYAPAHAHR